MTEPQRGELRVHISGVAVEPQVGDRVREVALIDRRVDLRALSADAYEIRRGIAGSVSGITPGVTAVPVGQKSAVCIAAFDAGRKKKATPRMA